MSETENERIIITEEIRFYDDEICAFLAYHYFLKQCISRGEKIPARVVKRYLEFALPSKDKSAEKSKKIQDFILKFKQRFSTPDYKIEGIESILENLLQRMFTEDFAYNNKGRDRMILGVYKEFCSHIIDLELTHYKKSVITAFITWKAMGYPVTETKEPTNSQLFDSTRHALRKLEKV